MSKRARSIDVPESFKNFLWGATRSDFALLKMHFENEHNFDSVEDSNLPTFFDDLLEELFRYLYLLAQHCDSEEEVPLAPSSTVEKAFCSLLHDPKLYYKVCDEILSLAGKDEHDVPIRLLDHELYSAMDDTERSAAYKQTLGKTNCSFAN